jgi:GSH-dependent disulfide-bond oxidoreductase
MIDLYYWPTPNGHKITIALEEMGLEYSIKPVNIGKGEQFSPDFLAFSPNNRMPAIIDHDGPDGKPISVFESGAVLFYLAAKTGKLMPADRRARIQVQEWLMWQMGGFGPMLGQAHHFNFYAPTRIDYAMKRYSDEANRLYGVMDKRLSENQFIAGESYSIADIAILPWTRSYKRQNVDIDAYPHVKAWRKTLLERPAVQAGGAVGADWREDLKEISAENYAKLFGAEKKS